jgi:hypothetical protein
VFLAFGGHAVTSVAENIALPLPVIALNNLLDEINSHRFSPD